MSDKADEGPTDDETDMKALEEGVRAIEKDGLIWGGAKLVAVGYGVKKLQINMVIEDDKISTDELQEQIESELEEFCQSTDIQAVRGSTLPREQQTANRYVSKQMQKL